MRDALYQAMLKSLASRYLIYIVNFLSLLILARMFSPASFGVVAAVAVFYSFFQVLGEGGVGASIINLKKLESADRDGVFSFIIILASFVSVGFYMASDFLAGFYRSQEVAVVVAYISASIFFFMAGVLPNSFLLRDKKFHLIAMAGFLSETVSTVCCIVLSGYIDPVEALSAKLLISALISFFSVYYLSSKTDFGKPFFGKKVGAIKMLLRSSSYQFGFNLFTYFSRNSDNILVARYYGPEALGFYDRAYQLMRYPLLLISFSINPAIQPVLRAEKASVSTIADAHNDLVMKLSFIGGLVSIVLYILAETIVIRLFGMQWAEVVPVFQVLCISVGVQVVYTTHSGFFQALDRFKLLFACGLLNSVVTIFCIVAGVYSGSLIGVCWGVVAAYHLSFLVVYYALYKRVFGYGFVFFLARTSFLWIISIAMTLYHVNVIPW